MPDKTLYIIPLRCYGTGPEVYQYHLAKVQQFYKLAKQRDALFRGLLEQEGLLHGKLEDLLSAAFPVIISSPQKQLGLPRYSDIDLRFLPELLHLVATQLSTIRKDHPNTLGYFLFQSTDQGHILLQTVIEAAAVATNFPLKIGKITPPHVHLNTPN